MNSKSALMYSFATVAAVTALAHADDVAASSHTVRSGDTLWSISQTHKIPVATLKSANGLTTDRIHVGQTLRLAGTNNGSVALTTSSQKVVTTAALNLRLAASTSQRVLLTIPKGQTLTPIQTSGSWVKVTYNRQTGWVHRDFVKATTMTSPVTPTSPSAPTTPAQTTSAKTTANLNLRVSKSANATIQVTIPKGKAVTVLRVEGAWSQVKYGTRTGYVANTYLTTSSAKPVPIKEESLAQSFVTTANLNVRQGAGIGYALVTTIPNGTTVTSSKKSGDWYYVTYNGKSGYVSAGYLKQTTTEPTAPTNPNDGDAGAGSEQYDYVVDTPSLNVRASASTNSAVIGSVKAGQTLRVVQTANGWHQIYIGNTTGYVAASFVKTVPKGSTSTPSTGGSATGQVTQAVRQAAIDVATKYVGTPYVWASSSPANGGFDCSGLIYYAFNQAGLKVPRTNVATYWSGSYFGAQLSPSFVPKTGDLVFFENTYTTGPSHMGIMINADTFIHAGSYGLGYNQLSKEPYWKSRLIGFKRP